MSKSDMSKINERGKPYENTITVTAIPVMNTVVEDVFQYPVVPNIDNHMSPKFAEEKNISPIPAPFIATGTNDNSKDNSNIKLYKVESDISVFNCAKVEEEDNKNAEPTNIKSNPTDSDDLLDLERRLAELSKSNTENTNPKEYSL